MKKIYLKPFAEFEEMEESLLYQPSIEKKYTTDDDEHISDDPIESDTPITNPTDDDLNG